MDFRTTLEPLDSQIDLGATAHRDLPHDRPGRVPLRGVKAEARFPCAESEQGGMTSCHS